jgi:hypothetical protein
MLNKERIEISKSGEVKRKSMEIEPPKEVANWLERVEKGDVYLAKPVIDDQTGQPLVSAPSTKQPKIVLPLDKDELILGLKERVNEAVKWLAEWCMRVIKMQPENVVFSESSKNQLQNSGTSS